MRGKWNVSGHQNDLEEYFAELESEEPHASERRKSSAGLSGTEEIRRLFAYVAYLRDESDRLPQRQPPSSSKSLFPNIAGLIAGIVVIRYLA